ncbi:MAG TPA: N-6 DNA methylase [Aridibacter sp.]|nr:N-6 DNA methylase [Aridibacter sp.]
MKRSKSPQAGGHLPPGRFPNSRNIIETRAIRGERSYRRDAEPQRINGRADPTRIIDLCASAPPRFFSIRVIREIRGCFRFHAIRGIDGQIAHGDTFHNDRHPDLKADFILANPPFNVSDWGGDRLKEDKRWQYGA